MRITLVFAVLLIAAPAMAAPYTKAECAEAAEVVGDGSKDVAAFAATLRRGKDVSFGAKATGGLKEASDRFDRSRAMALPAMREMLEATEDLAYQFKLCANR